MSGINKDDIPGTDVKDQTTPESGSRKGAEDRPSLKRPHPSPQTARLNRRLMPRTNQESFQDVKPSYFWEGGLRHVHPYTFEYQTYAKERWWGRTLLDVLTREFRDRPPSYYQAAILHQLITLNHQGCKLDTRVQSNNLLAHRLHRHEPPVSGEPIRILAEGEGLLVVDKPGSVPVHPSGRYRFNTLVEILRWERGYQHLSVINRLDRLTSGVCLLATNPLAAERLHQQMEDRQLRKEYIARVAGSVPWERMTCEEPLLVVEHKLGLVAVSSAGKAAHTEFIRLAIIDDAKEGRGSSEGMENHHRSSSGPAETSSSSTLLLCRPFTGRTHQIRVHLQHLGHPILNDTLYNHPIWRGEGEPTAEEQGGEGGEGGRRQPAKDERLQRIAQKLLLEVQEAEGDRTISTIDEERHRTDLPGGEIADSSVTAPKVGDPTVLCPECQHIRRGERRRPDQLCIYLHAWRYSSPTWSYETDTLPTWAVGITPEMLRRATIGESV